jgi:8-oxo-dGTP diphosphatase
MSAGAAAGYGDAAGADGRVQWPRVGVAVIVCHEGRVLVGQRIGPAHGSGTWQFPGGHLEPFELVEACATREVREETGLSVRVVAQGPYVNAIFDDARHYVTLFVVAEVVTDTSDATGVVPPEPELREPDKCAEWRWCAWDAMPTPHFLPITQLLALGYRPTLLR